MASQNSLRLEALALEKELGRKICFADLEGNGLPALLRELVYQFFNHLGAYGMAPDVRSDCEVYDMKPVFVEFVDHKADHMVVMLRDHTDAISLAETREKIFFGPFEVKTILFDAQDFVHVAADHPTDLACQFFFLRGRLRA